jgi:hypothetical protein
MDTLLVIKICHLRAAQIGGHEEFASSLLSRIKDLLVVEPDTVVFEEFKLKLVIAVAILVLVPNIFRFFEYLILLR